MSTHMTKLMRRLASAGLNPELVIWVERNQYRGYAGNDPDCIASGDTPEAAITAAVESAIAAKRGIRA